MFTTQVARRHRENAGYLPEARRSQLASCAYRIRPQRWETCDSRYEEPLSCLNTKIGEGMLPSHIASYAAHGSVGYC